MEKNPIVMTALETAHFMILNEKLKSSTFIFNITSWSAHIRVGVERYFRDPLIIFFVDILRIWINDRMQCFQSAI